MNNDGIKEQLSAFVDDELSEAERTLLLRRLETDAELRDQLQRFQLIRETVSQQLPTHIDLNFTDKVMNVVEQEPAHHTAPSRSFSDWLRPISGLAIAASVATLAIIGAQSLILDYRDTVEGEPTILASDYKRMPGTRWNTPHSEIGNRLNSYLVNHSEYTSSINIRGMMQYVRIAGYDTEPKKSEQKKQDKRKDQ